MIDKEQVKNRIFLLFHIDMETLDALTEVIADWSTEISLRLRDPLFEKDSRIIGLTAAYCARRIFLSTSNNDISSFKAGDVSISCGNSVKSSQEILKLYFEGAADLIRDDDFLFTVV